MGEHQGSGKYWKRKNQKHSVRSQQKGGNFKMFINSTYDNLNSKQLLGQGGHPRIVHQERPTCSLLPSQPPGSQIPHCSGCRTTQLQEEKQLRAALAAEGAGPESSSSTRGGFAHPWSKVGPKTSYQTICPLIIRTQNRFLWTQAAGSRSPRALPGDRRGLGALPAPAQSQRTRAAAANHVQGLILRHCKLTALQP